jgi:hypothetical protein
MKERRLANCLSGTTFPGSSESLGSRLLPQLFLPLQGALSRLVAPVWKEQEVEEPWPERLPLPRVPVPAQRMREVAAKEGKSQLDFGGLHFTADDDELGIKWHKLLTR